MGAASEGGPLVQEAKKMAIKPPGMEEARDHFFDLDTNLPSLKACKASMETGPTLDQFVEEIVWVDCRLQGYSLTGMRSWWFRTKARAKYYKIGGLGK